MTRCMTQLQASQTVARRVADLNTRAGMVRAMEVVCKCEACPSEAARLLPSAGGQITVSSQVPTLARRGGFGVLPMTTR